MISFTALIAALHATPGRGVLVVTGGGASTIAALLAEPGASRTVLEAVVPYHEAALRDWLGHAPTQYCGAEVTHALAARAFARAQQLAPGEPVFGAAATASLATDRPKRGEHRFFVATHGVTHRSLAHLVLAKGLRDRAGEEAVLHAVLLNALADSSGLSARVAVPLVANENLQLTTEPTPGAFADFIRGAISAVVQQADGRWQTDASATRPGALLCGSFNPLHIGHVELAHVVANMLGVPVGFELSVRNADKPELAPEELTRRAGQFLWHAPLWLTRVANFVDKARLFPKTTWIVGADTATRLVAPRYYGDDPIRRDEALATIATLGGRFLVAGRADATGRLIGVEDVPVPATFRHLFAGIPAERFRKDVSSTELRARRR